MSDPVLTVKNLSLKLPNSVYRPWTWRDLLVRAATKPKSLRSYGHLEVCRDITFSVYPGERVGLLGANGAGKTSLCRCLAGFYTPTSGTILRPPRTRALFETYVGILPELTGRENAQLLGRLLADSGADIDGVVAEAIEFAELGDFIDIPFRQYSKGMQARLGLSVSTMFPAPLLILDEVFNGADAFFSKKMAARMRSLIERSKAVIFVSHSVSQIRSVCNRAILIRGGRIAFDGDVEKALAVYEGSPPPRLSLTSREL
jgi:ABC-type polysaccharide/polyol phosphate transport system ATPase subunit